ncbi:MAG: hypothetical protein OQJ99_07850 [Rhodospirillales bacterium]|nr:hypothetical protein [Rhodospirillales bacterium]MCW8863183.1 hypothetical protein [Rhodospirillales bacterium]MCW8952488.1 hypothetical protein [Rhodospirillales bacterium]MCW8969726.1 hypothetical protein [Rhodospirillales bacterium]MCW9003369.1 hypothetical protein [Rhodospirillales bacterium]
MIEIGGISFPFHIVPALVFGPFVVAIFFKFGVKGVKGLPSEIIAKWKSNKAEYYEARKRRGFV